jgi:hypothetical protein
MHHTPSVWINVAASKILIKVTDNPKSTTIYSTGFSRDLMAEENLNSPPHPV